MTDRMHKGIFAATFAAESATGRGSAARAARASRAQTAPLAAAGARASRPRGIVTRAARALLAAPGRAPLTLGLLTLALLTFGMVAQPAQAQQVYTLNIEQESRPGHDLFTFSLSRSGGTDGSRSWSLRLTAGSGVTMSDYMRPDNSQSNRDMPTSPFEPTLAPLANGSAATVGHTLRVSGSGTFTVEFLGFKTCFACPLTVPTSANFVGMATRTFTIDVPAATEFSGTSTETNGGAANVIDGDDTFVMSGTITRDGANNAGMRATGNNNQILVDGTVTANADSGGGQARGLHNSGANTWYISGTVRSNTPAQAIYNDGVGGNGTFILLPGATIDGNMHTETGNEATLDARLTGDYSLWLEGPWVDANGDRIVPGHDGIVVLTVLRRKFTTNQSFLGNPLGRGQVNAGRGINRKGVDKHIIARGASVSGPSHLLVSGNNRLVVEEGGVLVASESDPANIPTVIGSDGHSDNQYQVDGRLLSLVNNQRRGVWNKGGSNNQLTLGSSGEIDLDGVNGRGIHNESGNHSYTLGGTVDIDGGTSRGIHNQAGDSTYMITGSVDIDGADGRGIHSEGGSPTYTISGTVDVNGANARGIHNEGGGGTYTITGTLSARGSGTPYAIHHESGSATYTIGAGASITGTLKADATAMLLSSGNFDLSTLTLEGEWVDTNGDPIMVTPPTTYALQAEYDPDLGTLDVTASRSAASSDQANWTVRVTPSAGVTVTLRAQTFTSFFNLTTLIIAGGATEASERLTIGGASGTVTLLIQRVCVIDGPGLCPDANRVTIDSTNFPGGTSQTVTIAPYDPASTRTIEFSGTGTETNGDEDENVVDGNDIFTLTNSGSITITGNDEPGVLSNGAGNTMNINGSVTANNDARGLHNESSASTWHVRGTVTSTTPAISIPGGQAIYNQRGASTYILYQGSTVSGNTIHTLVPATLDIRYTGSYALLLEGQWRGTAGSNLRHTSARGWLSVVAGAQTTTNGGNTLDGADTLTVASGGSIMTTAAGTDAIATTGANNRVVIDGTVVATGSGAYAVDNTGADTTVTIQGNANITGTLRTSVTATLLAEGGFDLNTLTLNGPWQDANGDPLLGRNFRPTLGTPIGTQFAGEGELWSFTVPEDAFNDMNMGDSLTLSAPRPLPTWVSFDAASNTFSGTPAEADVGNHSITVRATDNGGLFVDAVFTVAVGVEHLPPVVVGAGVPDALVDEDGTPALVVASHFNDPEGGALSFAYTVIATSPPGRDSSWLTIDEATGAFGGTPLNAHVGVYVVTVTATDNGIPPLSVTDSFVLTVANTNDAPRVGDGIPDQVVSVGVRFTLAVPAGAFADDDVNLDLGRGVGAEDQLTLSASIPSAIAGWMSFDPTSNTFSGTPAAASQGQTYTITVTASDRGEDGEADSVGGSSDDQSVSDTFDVEVNSPPEVPDASEARVLMAVGGGGEGGAAQPVTGNVLTAASDPENHPLTLLRYAAGSDIEAAPVAAGEPLEGEYGTLLMMADGAWTYTPGAGAIRLAQSASEMDEFTFEVGDGEASGAGGSYSQVTATLTITLTGANDGPVVARPIPEQQVAANAAYSFTVPAGTFTDPEGDALTYAAAIPEGAAWLSFAPATRTFSGVPDFGDVTPEPVTISVTATDTGPDGQLGTADDQGATARFTLEVTDKLDEVRDRNIGIALEGMARSLGWSAVDSIRGRVSASANAGRGVGLGDGLGAGLERGHPALGDGLERGHLALGDGLERGHLALGDGLGNGSGGVLQLARDGTGSFELSRGDRVDLSSVADLAREELRGRFMAYSVADPTNRLQGLGAISGHAGHAFGGTGLERGRPALDAGVTINGNDREQLNALAFGGNHLDALAAPVGGCAHGGVGDGAFRQPHKSDAPRSSEETLGSEATEGSPEGRKQWQRKAPLTTTPADCAVSHTAAHATGSSRMAADGTGWMPERLRMWVNVNRSEIAFDISAADLGADPDTAPSGSLSLDGDTLTANLGFEHLFANGVLGVAIGRIDSDMGLTDTTQGDASGDAASEGEVNLSQWSVMPYASHETGKARLWGAFGLGRGELDYSDNYLQRTGAGAIETGGGDTSMHLFAAGAEFDLAAYDRVDFVGRLEGMRVKLEVKADDANLFSEQEGDAQGARGELEVGWNHSGADGSYRAYLTSGFRWDGGGTIDKGVVAEYGGGLIVRGGGFTLDATARTQGSGGDVELDSYSIDLGYDSGGDGMGLTVNLRNTLGGGAALDPFVGRMNYDRFGSGSGSGSGGSGGLAGKFDASTMDLEAGYGLGARIGALTSTLRPYASMAFKGSALNRTKLGLRLDTAIGRLELLHSLRLAQTATATDEHSLELHAQFRF